MPETGKEGEKANNLRIKIISMGAAECGKVSPTSPARNLAYDANFQVIYIELFSLSLLHPVSSPHAELPDKEVL